MEITQEQINKHIKRLESKNDYSHLEPILNEIFNSKELRKLNNFDNEIKSLFLQLKKDNLYLLEDRYPNLIGDIERSKFLQNTEYLKLANIFSYIDIEKKMSVLVPEKFSKKDFILTRINLYLSICETIIFLFEDVLRRSEFQGSLSVGSLSHFLENFYPQYRSLFNSINKNIRNSIGHNNYEIFENSEEITFNYFDDRTKKFKFRKLSFQEFTKIAWESIYLFEVIFKNVEHCFLDEIKAEYRRNGFTI